MGACAALPWRAMARASADLIGPGLMLGGYRVDAVIGRGANTCVARATRLADGSIVAVKAFTIAGADADDRVRRLFHEARAGTAVDHPSLVKILDLGGVTHRPP